MKRTALALTLISALLFSAVAGAILLNLAKANFLCYLPEIVIKGDGSIEPSGIPIKKVGNIYSLTGDIFNCSFKIQCDNIIIDGQGFTLFTLQGWGDGFYMLNRNNVTIKNLNIKGYTHGIQLIANHLSATVNTGINILNNTFSDCTTGILFDAGVNDTISENTFHNNGCGIDFISNSYSNNISANIFVNDGWGMNIGGSYNNTFTLNTISESRENGIRIQSSQSNIFVRNNFTLNPNGILFDCTFEDSNGNLFHSNNFVDNSHAINQKSLRYSQNSIWDNGTQGNYWSDYAGNDTDGDGIGDTPYVIDANNTDHYPLMAPVDTVAAKIEVMSPESRTYDIGSIPLSFTINEAASQITYSLDGEENISIAGNATLTGLANGNHNLTIYAWDKAGNIGTSKTMRFTVDVPFPTTLVITASGALLAVVGIGLLVYFKKRNKKVSP